MTTTRSYIRYSDHKQDDGFSVEYQQSEIHDYCIRHGLEIFKEHIDLASTATKVAGREEFFRLMDAVKAGTVKTIIVYKLNRMFRNAYESTKYRTLMRKMGVRLLSVTQAIDEETSAGRLMTNVLSDIDQYQSETISDHVKSSMREMARQGYFTGGTVPFGYKLEEVQNGAKVRKKYAIDEKEAEVVEDLFRMFADNYSLRHLQSYLTNNDILTRRGKEFGITTIARILGNDFYIGTLRYKTQGYAEIVAPGAVPTIIDDKLWRRVQARKNERKLVKPRKKKDLYSLTGKLHCGLCGAHFFGVKSGSVKNDIKYEYKYYICSNRKGYNNCSCDKVRKEYIEQLLLAEIKTKILNESSIKRIALEAAEACEDSPENIQKQIVKLEKLKAKLEKNLDTLIEMRLDGEVTKDTAKKKAALIEEEIKEITGRLFALYDQREKTITPEAVEAFLREMLNNFTIKDEEVVKTIFDAFVENVIISNERLEIYLIVRPYGAFEYKETLGQPNVRLYSNILK
jgi:site-specific DNA recombinase